jgi:hypothetical protein
VYILISDRLKNQIKINLGINALKEWGGVGVAQKKFFWAQGTVGAKWFQ